MKQEQLDFLEQLMNTPTPTGSEAAGALMIGRRIQTRAGIQATIDIHGNLHAVYDVGAKRTIMLEGHGDEIGYIVKYIDASGFVYLQAIGGLIIPLSAAERITILSKNGPVNGVIGVRPPHLMNEEERKHAAANELKRMPCDIGASSREEAESLVSVGDTAVVASGWRHLAGTRVSGRGFDNRCGTFAMCEAFIKLATAHRKPKYNIHYVSSACEEIGLVGGRLASFNVHPDIGVSCDVGQTSDACPDDAKVVGDIRLGQGAIVSVGPIYHKGLTNHFLETAQKTKIPIQPRAIPQGMGNNGWSLKLEHGGAAVVQISVPLRYMHTPVEVADLKDIGYVIDLTAAAISSLDADFNLLPEQP